MREDYRGNLRAENFFLEVVQLVDGSRWDRDNRIIISSESCTLYPTVLKNMKLPSCQLVTFTIVEGQIVYEHRYHRYLCATEARVCPKARYALMDLLIPSHIGVHLGSPLLTIREDFDSLELQISIGYARNEIKLNLRQVILGYIGMRWTSICAYLVIKPMDSTKTAPLATSVASPAAATRRLGVAITRWDPVAQFLCYEDRYQAILQKECCLDCANFKTNGVIVMG